MYPMQSAMSNAEKERLIVAALHSGPGRHFLAQSMQQPLRLRRDYESRGRRAFKVEDLPDGVNPEYDKDINVVAYMIGESGENIVSQVMGRRVLASLFEIASNPKIRLTEIRSRRFDLLQRAQDLGVAQIGAAEDERVFAVLDALATVGYDSIGPTNPDIPVGAPITPSVMADAFGLIWRHNLSVTTIFMNALDYADLLKWGRDILSPTQQGALLRSGLMAQLWGASIVTASQVPAGFVYILTEPEYAGRIPVRSDITVLSSDNTEQRTIGYSIFENIGILAHNPYGLVRLIVAR